MHLHRKEPVKGAPYRQEKEGQGVARRPHGREGAGGWSSVGGAGEGGEGLEELPGK